jgi:glutathione peroxidase
VSGLYDIEVVTIDGGRVPLRTYNGRTLLIVNVASRCGCTPQYRGLELLYRRYKPAGFEVLGFPCNQFGRQEPGSNAEIREFCVATYGVTFPLFAKIDVKGRDAHPLYRFLTSQKRGWFGRRTLSWNFTKFLIRRDGVVVGRYGPRTKPEAIEQDLSALLHNRA